jgi:hypothetical protein
MEVDFDTIRDAKFLEASDKPSEIGVAEERRDVVNITLGVGVKLVRLTAGVEFGV